MTRAIFNDGIMDGFREDNVKDGWYKNRRYVIIVDSNKNRKPLAIYEKFYDGFSPVEPDNRMLIFKPIKHRLISYDEMEVTYMEIPPTWYAVDIEEEA